MTEKHKISQGTKEFFALCRSLDGTYLRNITGDNVRTMRVAAILTLVLEVGMILRLFASRPAMDTPASRIYLGFYVALIGVAALYLLAQRRMDSEESYWLQFGAVACYLLWNVLLNSYDLHRGGQGSSLALVSAIIFASILVHFRPHHMMILQGLSFILFFAINGALIEDKVNAVLAVTVAIVANVFFYVRDIRAADHQQRLAQMTVHMEREQMEGAMQYLRRLQESQTQTAIYHHDLRHTLNLVEQLAAQGNLERLKSFVSQSQENLNFTPPVLYCQHETVNLILGSFAQRAVKDEVDFEAFVRLPEVLPLADTELCSLLCNLLENALDSAKKVSDADRRRVYIKAVVAQDKLAILVENGYVGPVLMERGRPVPPMPDATHGFGVQSIIGIVERHRGLYVFETQRKLFIAKIMLEL